MFDIIKQQLYPTCIIYLKQKIVAFFFTYKLISTINQSGAIYILVYTCFIIMMINQLYIINQTIQIRTYLHIDCSQRFMNFVSQRQSQAQSFVSQTQNNSCLISSRKKIILDDAENDLNQFKEEIRYKFTRSIANKTYTYPLSQEAFDIVNDEEQLGELIELGEYDLHQQNSKTDKGGGGFKKQQFKVRNNNSHPSKVSSKTAQILLQSLNSEKDRLSNLRAYIQEGFGNKGAMYSRESNGKKSNKVLGGYQSKQLRENRYYDVIYEEPEQKLVRKKRLLTQPYQKIDKMQKNAGFIIKRK